MEAYRNNSAVEVLGKFHAFLRWKERVYRQLFYVTDANNSPDVLSRDGCYILGVIKPSYSVESTRNSSKFQEIPEVTSTHLQSPWRKQSCMVIHLIIVEMKEMRWLNGMIPKNPASRRMRFKELH